MNAYSSVGTLRTMHPDFRQNIPLVLRQRPQWIVWAGDKVPYNALTGHNASVVDCSTWTTFEAAANAYESNQSYSGLGFVFEEGGGITGVDLDRKQHTALSADDKTAQDRIWQNFDTYQEVSPSGTGLHVICLGTVSTAKTAAIEVYSANRYFTFTGDLFGALRDVTYQQENLNDLVEYLERTKSYRATESTAELLAYSRPMVLSDDEVLSALQRHPRWEDINTLACGDAVPLVREGKKDTSGSAIDMALMNYIVVTSGNAAQAERIWLSTRHGNRQKTQTNAGYRTRTIARAFDRMSARPSLRCPVDPSIDAAFAHGTVEGTVPAMPARRTDVSQETAQQIPTTAEQLDSFDIQPYAIIPADEIPYEVNIYGTHHQKGLVSLTVAAGGTGKSSLTIIEALAMTTGRQLLRVKPERPLRVWLHNGEDPMMVLNARIAGAAKSYGLTSFDTGGRLLVTSGHNLPLKIAKIGNRGYEIDETVVRKIKATILRYGIEVMTIDPLMSFHSVQENDNGAMDAVIKELGKIASETGCAIDVVHHTTKSAAVGSAASRGASSIVDAARAVRVLAHLEPNELEKLPIGNYLKVSETKNNNNARATAAALFVIQGEDLKNGNGRPGKVVPVVKTAEWPQKAGALTDDDARSVEAALVHLGMGEYRESSKSSSWVGHAISEFFDIRTRTDNGRKEMERIVFDLIKAGKLCKFFKADPVTKRQNTPFVRVAETRDDQNHMTH